MGMKILVVEDNELNMKLFERILLSENYEVLKASNAEDGVEIARKELPEIVLMDIQLPKMNGIEALRVLKTQEETKNIKVIALTAYAMVGDREKFLDEGFDAYIKKPVSYKNLIEKINKLI